MALSKYARIKVNEYEFRRDGALKAATDVQSEALSDKLLENAQYYEDCINEITKGHQE